MKVVRFDSEQTAKLDIRPAESGVIWKQRHRAMQEGQALLAAARTEARQIVADAEGHIRSAKRQAIDEGLAQGRAELEEALAEVLRLKGRTLERLQPDLIRLAVTLAARVMRAEVKTRPELITSICRGVLREYRVGQEVRIQVNKSDLPVIQADRERLARELGVAVQLEANGQIARGGCIVRGSHGSIDARLGVQLAFLAKMLSGGQDHAG
jgi:flagellar biosynthesis/type III secretory pathway protein FliH